MDIGNAVSLLKQGFKVQRLGWDASQEDLLATDWKIVIVD